MKKKGILSKLYHKVRIPWGFIILGGFLAVFNSIVILTQYENYMAIFTGTMKDLSPLFAYLVASFVQYVLIFASVISSIALVTVVTRVRKKVWKKMMHLPVRTFEKETPEGMLSRITSDAEYASQPFAAVITILQIITYMMSMTAAAPKDLPQALPFLIISLIISVVCIVLSAKLLSRAVTEVQTRKSEQTASYSEKLANIRLVKAGNAEEKVIAQSLDLIEKRYQASLHNAFAQGMQTLANNCTYIIIYSCAFLGGIVAISQGAIKDVAPINAVYVFGMALELTLVAIMTMPSLFAGAIGGSRKLASVFDLKEEDIDSGNKADLTGDIVLNNVSFAYDEENAVNNVSTVIPEGKVTAIIGTNGSGKSTLIKLIDRLYINDNGNICIGAQKADSVSLKTWRDTFGVVAQNASLFSGTLRENLTYGTDREISDKELKDVIEYVGLKDVIEEHAEGLDYSIGMRGSKLSGGQQQRLSIARALLKDPKILILDEATANLDAKSEAEVKETMHKLMKDRTVIIIAHNASFIEDADKIIVMKDGSIEASGSIEEVTQQSGYFRRLLQG